MPQGGGWHRSRAVWGLLIVPNAHPLLPAGGLTLGSGGDILWVNVVVTVTTGIALEAVLHSPAMRRYVANRRPARPMTAPPVL